MPFKESIRLLWETEGINIETDGIFFESIRPVIETLFLFGGAWNDFGRPNAAYWRLSGAWKGFSAGIQVPGW
jgi:hypothetical protein